mgnify:CR=1 FL=1
MLACCFLSPETPLAADAQEVHFSRRAFARRLLMAQPGGFVAMDRGKYACALLVLLAASGCRMCQSYTDCAPVVPDGPYSNSPGRAGSILSGGTSQLPSAMQDQSQPAEFQPAASQSAGPQIEAQK